MFIDAAADAYLRLCWRRPYSVTNFGFVRHCKKARLRKIHQSQRQLPQRLCEPAARQVSGALLVAASRQEHPSGQHPNAQSAGEEIPRVRAANTRGLEIPWAIPIARDLLQKTARPVECPHASRCLKEHATTCQAMR